MPSKASNLYVGQLFKKSLSYAKTLKPQYIFILSAKHGLLELDDFIAPYEMTLKHMNKQSRLEWATTVRSQLETKIDLASAEFHFLAGLDYREHLSDFFPNHFSPLEGKKQGEQLKWLNNKI